MPAMVSCLSCTSASPAGPLSPVGAAPAVEGANFGPLVTAGAQIVRGVAFGPAPGAAFDRDTTPWGDSTPGRFWLLRLDRAPPEGHLSQRIAVGGGAYPNHPLLPFEIGVSCAPHGGVLAPVAGGQGGPAGGGVGGESEQFGDDRHRHLGGEVEHRGFAGCGGLD